MGGLRDEVVGRVLVVRELLPEILQCRPQLLELQPHNQSSTQRLSVCIITLLAPSGTISVVCALRDGPPFPGTGS